MSKEQESQNTKVIYHGTTIIDDSGDPSRQFNPPPYTENYPTTGSGYPHPQQPAYPAPGPTQSQPTATYTTGAYVTTSATVVQPAVVVSPTGVIITNQMSPKPQPYQCKSCLAHIVTRVDQKPTTRTHIFALILCLLGCWPCVCIPYCMDDCLSTDHYCPNCNAFLGSYIS